MIFELPEADYAKTKLLLRGREDINVHLSAVIDRNNRGKIYVDNVSNPQTAIIWAVGCMYFIVGNPDNENFNPFLNEYIGRVLGPESREACGGTHFAVTIHDDEWLKPLSGLFSHRNMQEGIENLYIFNQERFIHTPKKDMDGGSHVQKITKNIIEKDIEKCIESDILGDFWISVDMFLEKGFGFAVLDGDRPVSCCFTGYVSGIYNDIVIRTYKEKDRRKGFAASAAGTYIEYCISNHLIPHWRTEAENTGSNAAAVKCGFELYKKCRTYCFPFD